MIDADAGPPRIPYRRPERLQQPAGSTTQTHLDATQMALQLALIFLKELERESSFGPGALSPNDRRVGMAREDLIVALGLTAAATAYIHAHPESNALASGSAPAGEPQAPSPPTMSNDFPADPGSKLEALQAVNLALRDLINQPQSDHHLGDIGGLRLKLLAAITQVGDDLRSEDRVYSMASCGSTVFIPRPASAHAGSDLAEGRWDNQDMTRSGTGSFLLPTTTLMRSDANSSPTARRDAEEMVRELADLRQSLSPAGNSYSGDKTEGGFVTKVLADLQHATADLTAALAYLDAPPEATASSSVPHETKLSTAQPVRIPDYAPRSFGRNSKAVPNGQAGVPPLTAETIIALNQVIIELLNNQAVSGNGDSGFGDLSGYRAKIMDEIGQAQTDALAGMDFNDVQERSLTAR